MILSDKQILEAIDKEQIVITPFDKTCLGPNSYDVHLSKYLATYDMALLDHVKIQSGDGQFRYHAVLDAKKHNEIKHFEIPEEGFVLHPGVLYLGSTLEYTATHAHIPFLEGKSSTGRLGINIHATAGKGDVGFCNHWTFEISCIHPVRIYAGMPIAQLIYHETGECEQQYCKRKQSKYTEVDPRPKESMMFKNKF